MYYYNKTPVAIGGLGGSGTRFVATILEQSGYYIGSDLNRANDNLWFTFLFKRAEILSISDQEFRRLTEIFIKRMTAQIIDDQKDHELIHRISTVYSLLRETNYIKRIKRIFSDKSGFVRWQRLRTKSLLVGDHNEFEHYTWGWKEPNTHVVLNRLLKVIPNLKYIHVIRNGCDMAFNRNQNQIRFWGDIFLNSSFEITPHYSLKFWCKANRRVFDICNKANSNYFVFRYDDLFTDPKEVIRKLLIFINVKDSKTKIDELLKLIKIPESLGVHKKHSNTHFDVEDLRYVQKLGFDTN